MKFSQEGEWLVSTPVYVGMSEDVKKASACTHAKYSRQGDPQMIHNGKIEVHFERCANCVAVRVKLKGDLGGEDPEKLAAEEFFRR